MTERKLKKQVDLLVTHAVVLPMTEDMPVLFDAAIAIKSGKIAAIGKSQELSEAFAADRTIDASGQAVLPGFVNTHFHFMQNFLKGSRDDCDLLEWIDKVSFPRIKAVVQESREGKNRLHEASAIHAGIDLLKSGITTTVNMEWAMRPSIVDVYDKIGFRVINTLTLTDVKSWTPEAAVLSDEEYFELADALIDKCRSSKDSRSSFAYGLACPNSCTEHLIKRTREEAYKNNVPVHIHLAETEFELKSFLSKYGLTPTAYLEKIGLWDKDTWGAHCIWVTDEDIEILKNYDVGIAHNPKCNMKIADGAAPIVKMLRSGLDVGLGIDSCAVSDNTDFFEAMRTYVFLQRLVEKDATVTIGSDALKMATIGGARAVKMGDQIGSLEIGKCADMIFIDLARINMRPFNNLINNIVFAANSQNIKRVMVGGDILVEDGLITAFDEEEAINEAENCAYETFRSHGLELPTYFNITQIK